MITSLTNRNDYVKIRNDDHPLLNLKVFPTEFHFILIIFDWRIFFGGFTAASFTHFAGLHMAHYGQKKKKKKAVNFVRILQGEGTHTKSREPRLCEYARTRSAGVLHRAAPERIAGIYSRLSAAWCSSWLN